MLRLSLCNLFLLFNSSSDCTSFVPTAELIMPTETQINEVIAEIEIQLVVVEAKISENST